MLPALTVVAKIAPNAMKAPPRMLSTRKVSGSIEAADAVLFGTERHSGRQDCIERNQ